MNGKIREKIVWNISIDIAIIIVSIIAAVFLERSHLLEAFMKVSEGRMVLGSLVAGVFFTSAFTTVPALVVLGELSHNHILLVAFLGACGAVLGDLIIFTFVKDRFSDDIMQYLDKEQKKLHVRQFLKKFRWASILIGAIIIASPLPDELGIGLMGFTKMKTRLFMLISFMFNFGGLVIIGLAANLL